MKVYLVGGAVRDKLLGLPIRELDWVVVGETMESLLQQGFKKVGKDFPVFLHPKTQQEYALARTERKIGKGYYGFEIHASPDVTLEEDLSRRDLTINAMAETEQGEIIDPFQGLEDIKAKILRHVSPAFREDPVRILRIARFAARFAPLGFSIAKETYELMRLMVDDGEVDALVPERVWQETQRALCENDPTQYFLVLRECGALKRLWPALDKLWGVPQPEQHHPEIDTGVHTMMALKEVVKKTADPITRFATLCHDLGKGETPISEWPSHRGHEERGVSLIQDFCKTYHVPNEYRDLAILVSRYHLHCHKVFELREITLLRTLEHLDAFRRSERFEKFLLACECDARGRKGLETRNYPQSDYFRKAFLAAKSVNVKPLVEAGFEGEKLKIRLHQLRIEAIRNLKLL